MREKKPLSFILPCLLGVAACAVGSSDNLGHTAEISDPDAAAIFDAGIEAGGDAALRDARIDDASGMGDGAVDGGGGGAGEGIADSGADGGDAAGGNGDGGGVDGGGGSGGAPGDGGVGVCSPGGEQVLGACGNCGTSKRICDASGDWGPVECSGEGSCAPGTSRFCVGSGMQKCNASCEWDPCVSCTPGDWRACGAGAQTCSPRGTWCECQQTASDSCSGSPGGFQGCRGNGCAVCAEKVREYPCYFENHPQCKPNHTCGGQYGACNANCPAPTLSDKCTCNGTAGEWNGCRGTGCSACSELVADYPCYFIHRPSCMKNDACGGEYYQCNDRCSAPGESDWGSL